MQPFGRVVVAVAAAVDIYVFYLRLLKVLHLLRPCQPEDLLRHCLSDAKQNSVNQKVTSKKANESIN